MVKAAFAILTECAYCSKLQIHEQHRTRDCENMNSIDLSIILINITKILFEVNQMKCSKCMKCQNQFFSSTTCSLSEINKRRFHFRAVVFSNKYFKVFCCLQNVRMDGESWLWMLFDNNQCPSQICSYLSQDICVIKTKTKTSLYF